MVEKTDWVDKLYTSITFMVFLLIFVISSLKMLNLDPLTLPSSGSRQPDPREGEIRP